MIAKQTIRFINQAGFWLLWLKYVEEILKLLPKKPDRIVIQHISEEIVKIGSINAV